MAKRGRPPLTDAERRVHLTLRVSPETKADIVWLAKVADISRGEVVDIAIDDMAKRKRR